MTTIIGAIGGIPGTELGARDDEEVEKGRQMAIGPENRPDFNDAGDIGCG